MIHRLIVATLLAFSFVLPLSAQDETSTLEGAVVGTAEDFRFEGARVQIVGTSRRTSTDRRGRFSFPDLSPGTYELRVTYVGAPSVTETVELGAGETRRIEIRLGDGDDLERMVVVGQAAVQSASLAREQSALNNINVLSADAIGQFPDNNVAEALQRVPGLSLERDQGEGRFVVIRGANAEFNTVCGFPRRPTTAGP
jgi:hypothetical protein